MGSLYYGKLKPVTFTATTAASGYAAANVGLESIRRPWLATNAGANDVTLVLTAATAIQALLLQDVNFATATIAKSADNVTFSAVGTMTPLADKWTNRYRGLIVINDANVKAVKISIGAGTPLDSADGVAQWRIGAAYLFSSVSAFARMPDFGFELQPIFPKVQATLPNQQISEAVTGADILGLSLPYERRYDQDVLEILRRARKGTVGLALTPTHYDELFFPVRHVGQPAAEKLSFLDLSTLNIDLREVV